MFKGLSIILISILCSCLCEARTWVYPSTKKIPEVAGSWEDKKRAYVGSVGGYIDYYNEEFIKVNKLEFKFDAIPTYDKEKMIQMNEKLGAEFFGRPVDLLVKDAHEFLNKNTEKRLSQSDRVYLMDIYDKLTVLDNSLHDYDAVLEKVEALQRAEARLIENEKKANQNLLILAAAIVAFILYARRLAQIERTMPQV